MLGPERTVRSIGPPGKGSRSFSRRNPRVRRGADFCAEMLGILHVGEKAFRRFFTCRVAGRQSARGDLAAAVWDDERECEALPSPGTAAHVQARLSLARPDHRLRRGAIRGREISLLDIERAEFAAGG